MKPPSSALRSGSARAITSASASTTKGSAADASARSTPRVTALVGAMVIAMASTGAASAAANFSEATVTVEGGPHAGTHKLRVEEVGCELSKTPGRPRYFNDNFGLTGVKDANTLSFVLVRMRNADGPGSPAHADFDASVTFGRPQGKPSTYYMSGTNDLTGRIGGPGKLSLKEDGDIARVSFDLDPQPGIKVKGQLSCTIVRY